MRHAGVIACLLLMGAGVARAEDGLSAEQRHTVELLFLQGNLEELASLEPDAHGADDRFPFALRDLYWRPDPGAASDYEAFAAADGLDGARYRWLLKHEPRGPFPGPDMGAADTWPMLTALVADRIRRETVGAAGLPEASPVAQLASVLGALEAGPGLDEATAHRLWYLKQTRNQLSEVVHGRPPSELERRAEEDGAAIRSRNAAVAVVALLLLIAGSLLTARRRRPPASEHEPSA